MLENCQKDINIALMNELNIYFKKINVDTEKVIEAASTKWELYKYFRGLLVVIV